MSRDSISFKRQLASKLFSLTKWHAWLPSRHSRILMYHRVINPESEPIPQLPGMFIRPETFRMHLEYLTKYFKIIPLEDLIANYCDKLTTKEKYIALTFDDAWVDFKTNALPILEEFEAPATVFVPTKFIDTGELFWNDIILLTLKSSLDLKDLSTKYNINFSNNPTDLIENLKNDRNKRNLITVELKQLLSQELKAIPPQFLSWEDIKSISKKGLVTFGSHTHSHEIATQMKIEDLKLDIELSLENFKSKEISAHNTFCYPNQSRNDETDRCIKNIGFKNALGLNKNVFSYSRIGLHEDISCDPSLFNLSLGI